MMMQAVDPERAVIAAGIMIIIGIAIFIVRNKKTIYGSFFARGGDSSA